MKKFIAKILILTTLCSIVPIPAFVQAQSSYSTIYENLGISKEELDKLINEHGFYKAIVPLWMGDELEGGPPKCLTLVKILGDKSSTRPVQEEDGRKTMYFIFNA